MNTNKLLALCFTSSAILILSACGGSSSATTTSTLTKITTIDEAKTSYQAISATSFSVSFGTYSGVSLEKSSTVKNTFNKTETYSCDTGSITIDISNDKTTHSILAEKCNITSENRYMNGNMTIENFSNENKVTFTNLELKSSDSNVTITKMVLVNHKIEKWTTIDGDITIVSPCFSGTYNYETIEKIYDTQDDSNNSESGILKMNDVTYTFNNPYVTIKIGDTEETILQSELEKRMDSSSCSE